MQYQHSQHSHGHDQGHDHGHDHSHSDFDSVFKHSLNDAMANGRWQDLLANVGADVAESVRGALTDIADLTQAKRIDNDEAQTLQAPLRRLYQVGVAAQRLSRLADHPRVTLVEPVKLGDVVADAKAYHQKRSRIHKLMVETAPIEVMAQPEVLAAAVDSLFLWSMKLGRHVSMRLVQPPGSSNAELWMRVEALHRSALEDRNLNSIDWHVLWQLARLKRVKVKRKIEDKRIRVQVQFNSVMRQHNGVAILEQGLDGDEGMQFDALSTVAWAIIPRSHLSAVVHQTLSLHMPNLHLVNDMRALMHDGRDPPDCIISMAEVLHTDDFKKWRRAAQLARGRSIAVVEITPESNVFEVGGMGAASMARLSADSVSQKLLSAIVFELSQLHGTPH